MNLFLGMLRMGFLVDFYSIFPIGNASFFIIAYGEAFQMVAHASTAVNRYAVLSRHAVVVRFLRANASNIYDLEKPPFTFPNSARDVAFAAA